MYDGKKAMVFGSLGLAFGYFCHRLVLLWDCDDEPSLSLRLNWSKGLPRRG